MTRDIPSRMQEDEKKDKRSRLLILLLLLLLLIALGIILWMLFFRQEKQLTPDYAPRQEDKYAQSMDDGGGGEKLPQSQGGGAVSLMYGVDVTIDRAGGTASLLFGNPSESNQDIVIQLVVQDVVLAQSDRLVPGKQLRTMELLDGAAERLQSGAYNGKLVVLFYQPDSGEKAIVNTEIQVDVTVQ